MTHNNICKACGNTMQGSTCKFCGWTRFIYPANIPIELKEMENKRIECAKNIYDKIRESTNKDKEIEKNKKEIVTLSAEIDEMQTANDNLKNELRRLNDELKEAKTTMPAGKFGSSGIVGIVHIVNNKNNDTCYCPIYSGENTYGSDESRGNHHYIDIRSRRETILPKHFSVSEHKERLVIRDLSNGNIRLNGTTIPSNGYYVEPQNIINIGEYIEIHISKI